MKLKVRKQLYKGKDCYVLYMTKVTKKMRDKLLFI